MQHAARGLAQAGLKSGLDLSDLDLAMGYATNSSDVIAELYAPCLSRSVSYDRAVGYFRSSILALTANAVALFAERGGHIRLVCSPDLTEEDINSLRRGYTWRDVIDQHLVRVLTESLSDPLGRFGVEYLANLVASRCLDLKVAFRIGSRGIFHAKTGIFADNTGHAVSFTGSSNETFSGWDGRGNHEAIDVFCSWREGDARRVAAHTRYFQRLWQSEEPGVVTIDFPDVAVERLRECESSRKFTEILELLEDASTGRHPVLRTHQAAALASWRDRGYRGILEHATGSGKTITALAGISEWVATGRPALVVVPSTLLLHQWYDEARAYLRRVNDLRILLVGAGYNHWRQSNVLGAFTQPDGSPRLVIATMQTASRPEFLERVVAGAHLLVVADEVHRLGAPQHQAVTTIDAGGRLGLSATPQRFGDVAGTDVLFGCFGPTLEPIYTLQDAIAAGVLCAYEYHVHRVFLTADEVLRWRKLTVEISAEVARASGSSRAITWSERAKLLLLKRSRILKSAASKVDLAVQVIAASARTGDRWLIYCDSQSQLNNVRDALAAADIDTLEYHSEMRGDREATLRHFELVGGIIVAIKCLDEGVDIPAIDRALILASSRNPREFIQRRGRVLRRSPGKDFAIIHDALVFPPLDTMEPMDVGVAVGELARANIFAAGATNEAVLFKLREFMLDIGLDPSTLDDSETTEDD